MMRIGAVLLWTGLLAFYGLRFRLAAKGWIRILRLFVLKPLL